MLIEKVIGNLTDYPVGDRKIDRVMLEWYELDKKILRRQSQAGEEVGIRIENHLHEGDVLYADEQKVLVVDLRPCQLTEVAVHSRKEMGRLCFELGNRHLSLAIEEDNVRIPYDEPTFQYLQKLGFAPVKVEEKFSHFTVCHAHGDHHHGEHHHEH